MNAVQLKFYDIGGNDTEDDALLYNQKFTFHLVCLFPHVLGPIL